MRALRLKRPGELSIETIEDPVCQDGGVLVKVDRCSVCSTDVRMWEHGHRDLIYPRTLGHEVVGTIVEDRSYFDDLEEGVRAQIAPGIPCGSCKSCQMGRDNQCVDVGIFGFNRDGGFAEYVSVPEISVENGGVNVIPDHVPMRTACLVEPLASCINAQDSIRIGEMDSVLVIGGGPTGLMHVQVARSRDVNGIIVSEPSEDRRESAMRAGSNHVIDPSTESLRERVEEITDGEMMDAIIIATRDFEIDRGLLDLLSPCGRVSLFSGLRPESAMMDVDLNRMHYRELSIGGAYGNTLLQNTTALGMIADRSVSLDWMVTMEADLEDSLSAFEHVRSREGLRAVVRCD